MTKMASISYNQLLTEHRADNSSRPNSPFQPPQAPSTRSGLGSAHLSQQSFTSLEDLHSHPGALDRLGVGVKSIFDGALREQVARGSLEEIDDSIQYCGLSKETSKIEYAYFDSYKLKVLNFSPYPPIYHRNSEIHICKQCLGYFVDMPALKNHIKTCSLIYPPGLEIYRHEGNLSFFAIDGARQSMYCRNICLFAKIFLNTKVQYVNVDYFYFYVLMKITDSEATFLGFFSKEKSPKYNYNLSCIVVLPCFIGNGYGKLLIDLSYVLTTFEKKKGMPEGPLSNAGLMAYRSYWRDLLLKHLAFINEGELNIDAVCEKCGTEVENLVDTLLHYKMIKCHNEKFYVISQKAPDSNKKSTKSNKKTKKMKHPFLYINPKLFNPIFTALF